jgi:hypothetical protein
LRKNVFLYRKYDPTSWEYKSHLGTDGSRLTFGLGRFLMAEADWNVRNIANIVRFGQGEGDKEQLYDYLTAQSFKSALFGVGSIIPSFLWTPLEERMPEEWKPLFRAGISNLLGDTVISAGADAFGVERPEFSLTEAVQPGTLVFGARAGQIGQTVGTALTGGFKSAGDISEAALTGNSSLAGAASLEALGSLGAASSLLPLSSQTGKVMPLLENAQFRKLLNASAEAMRDEQTGDKTYRETAKALFGSNTVKKAED